MMILLSQYLVTKKKNVGYNPKYHGRSSYKEKVGIISDTKELIDLTLEAGSLLRLRQDVSGT